VLAAPYEPPASTGAPEPQCGVKAVVHL